MSVEVIHDIRQIANHAVNILRADFVHNGFTHLGCSLIHDEPLVRIIEGVSILPRMVNQVISHEVDHHELPEYILQIPEPYRIHCRVVRDVPQVVHHCPGAGPRKYRPRNFFAHT